jgi:hypothetical protein
MKLVFAVETGQPGGAYFRMVFEVFLTLPSVWMVRLARQF